MIFYIRVILSILGKMNAKMKMKCAAALLAICGLTCGCADGEKKARQEKERAAVESVDTASICRRTVRDTITELPYDIPAQRFDETAQQLVHATGCFIESDLSKTGAVRVNPVKGRMSILEAVQMAIKGTNLRITEEQDDRIKVELINNKQ